MSGLEFATGDDLTAARLNLKTRFVGTGAQIAALSPQTGQIAYCTSTGSGFTAGTQYVYNGAVWTEAATSNTDIHVYPYSTSLSDYAPYTTTLSSGTSAAANYDYASSTGWTQVNTQVTISGGTLNFATTQGASTANRQAQHRAIGSTLPDVWTCEFEFRWTAQAAGGTFHIVAICDSNAQLGTGTLDVISAIYSYSGSARLAISAYDAGVGSTSSFITNIASSTTYYCRLERTSPTQARLSVFSDASRTVHVSGSPVTLTINSTITGLGTIQHSNQYGDGTGNTLTATVDNVIINSTFQTNSELNPWIKAELSAAADKEPAAIAYNYNSATTATQIKIQTSTDNTTWTDKRIINTSALTAGITSYIRINRDTVQVRYIRMYVPDGTAKVLSGNIFTILVPTEAQWNRRHGHKSLSATDATLALSA